MANTQDVLDSTNALMERVKTEGITDSIGNVLQAPINASTLQGSGGTVVVPNAPTTPAPALVVPPPPVQVEDPLGQAQADYLKSLQQPATDTAGQYAQAEKDAGLPAKEQQVNDLSAQLNVINANATAAQQQLESQAGGKDITTSFLGRQQQEIGRQAAIKGLPIAAALSAAQGNLSTAQAHLDKLFEFKTADAKAKMEYDNKLAEVVYGFASEADKKRLDAQIRKETRDDAIATANRAEQADYAKTALASGQMDLMSKISALDEKSPTFKADLAKLTKQIKENPTAILDRQIKQAQLAKTLAETANIGVEDTKKIIAGKEAEKTQLKQLGDKISLIDTLIGNAGMSGTVGVYGIGRWTPLKIDKAEKANFIAGVEQLISQETLDTLLELKKAGGTLGAISEKELAILEASASRIGSWKLKDKNGKVTGYQASEEDFTTELKKIKKSAQIIIDGSAGKDVNQYLDSLGGIFEKSATANIYSQAGY